MGPTGHILPMELDLGGLNLELGTLPGDDTGSIRSGPSMELDLGDSVDMQAGGHCGCRPVLPNAASLELELEVGPIEQPGPQLTHSAWPSMGKEYQKHAAFRRDNGLIDAHGKWILSRELCALRLPPMPPRVQDLLHIIWLTFERQGTRPRSVQQVWMLCQSIHRGSMPHYPEGYFHGKMPQTPGLHFHPRGRHAVHALAPCILPCSLPWVNAKQHFASGAECLQLQGVHLPTMCPRWHIENDAILRRIAGDMYTIPVVGWYVLLAVTALTPRVDSMQWPTWLLQEPCAQTAGDSCRVGLAPAAMARALLETLLKQWPGAFRGCLSPITISLGSLCSGADFVKLFARALLTEISCLPGAPQFKMRDVFACECDQRLWEVRRRAMQDPECRYNDIHKLPLAAMESVDICLMSPMCKSISHCNTDRRSLSHTDVQDPKCCSGATMASAISYVEAAKPKVIICENVAGMLDRVAPDSDVRNVDILLSALRKSGYACGYDMQDACEWFMPQTRRRVYVWGHRLETAQHVVAGLTDGAVRLLKPSGHIALDDCLLLR